MRIYTIGYTRTSARWFFERLRNGTGDGRPSRLVDVRMKNNGQLSGFAKGDDLTYFCGELCNIPYEHRPELAPTHPMFKAYKMDKGPWGAFEEGFINLMRDRQIERLVNPGDLNGACLMCSEDVPHHCHRRLVAEYLGICWGGVEIVHL